MIATVRPDVVWNGWSLDTVAEISPAAALARAWAQAVGQGRLDVAAVHRRRLEALGGEEPTWEDAEWQ